MFINTQLSFCNSVLVNYKCFLGFFVSNIPLKKESILVFAFSLKSSQTKWGKGEKVVTLVFDVGWKLFSKERVVAVVLKKDRQITCT